ncbi:MAG: endo-1,4-beta-xylanase [Defluviitaleaceae bacterium]|nr:endo-1,4-beta-xylanase [Defluviitaleaceae bacterium]
MKWNNFGKRILSFAMAFALVLAVFVPFSATVQAADVVWTLNDFLDGRADGESFSSTDAVWDAGISTGVTVNAHAGQLGFRLVRNAGWHGIDLRADSIGFQAGDTITATGRSDGAVPAGAQIQLARNPGYSGLATEDFAADGSFTISHTLSDADASGLVAVRVNTTTGANNLFVDTIVVTRAGGGTPAATPAATPAGTPRPPSGDMPTSLREAFEPYFLVGNIWHSSWRKRNMDSPASLSFFQYHFNAVSAEDYHKVDQLLGAAAGAWNWTNWPRADRIVNWGNQNDVEVIGHALVWHSQSRAWLTTNPANNQPLTRAQAVSNMEQYINTVAGRYAGRVRSWDVVNEALNSWFSLGDWNANPDWRAHLRITNAQLAGSNTQWYNAFANGATGDQCGSDFIYYAFRFARIADPDAILYYNDYNEEAPGKRNAIVHMVTEINERWTQDPLYDGRLLIEVIGMQSHYHMVGQWRTNFNYVRPAMIAFIGTGARISITELDITVGGGHGGPNTPAVTGANRETLFAQQANYYARLFRYYLEFHEHIDRVSFWGMGDPFNWRASGYPCIFDANLQPKPAFHAIMEVAYNHRNAGAPAAATPTPTPTPSPSPTPTATPTPTPTPTPPPTPTPTPTPTPPPAITTAPNINSASTWAHDYINRSVSLGFVPQGIQNSYNQNITRAEFATLAVSLYEFATGRTIAGRVTFADTTDINIERAAYLDIVRGVGNDNFNPTGNLTRQEAATMMARLAHAIGHPLPANSPTFADNDDIATWAAPHVGQSQASGIMGGVGNNRFDPLGAYTREQSIITMLRLYDIVS